MCLFSLWLTQISQYLCYFSGIKKKIGLKHFIELSNKDGIQYVMEKLMKLSFMELSSNTELLNNIELSK